MTPSYCSVIKHLPYVWTEHMPIVNAKVVVGG
jgi:hypothetical protein